jgi:hypothetical protein
MGKRERIERVEAAPGEPFDRGLFRVIEEDLSDTSEAREARTRGASS